MSFISVVLAVRNTKNKKIPEIWKISTRKWWWNFFKNFFFILAKSANFEIL